MAVRNDVQLLRKVPLFAGVDPAYLQVLAFSSKSVTIKAGQYLVRQDKPVSAGFLILDGKAEAAQNVAGREIVAASLGPGAFVCAKCMVAKLPPNMSIKALNSLTAMQITHELFVRVCKEFPDTGAQILKVLSNDVDISLRELKRVQSLFDRAQSFSRM